MNLTLLIDERMSNMARTLAPHYNIVNLDYFKINGNLYLPSTIMPNIANYLASPESKSGSDSDVIKKLIAMS